MTIETKYGPIHGVSETGAPNPGYHMQWNGEYVLWTDPDLEKILRLRLLSDPGLSFWDVSYCYGQMKNGEIVRVDLPFSQLPKGSINVEIIRHAKRDRVFAKGLGVFDAISTLC